MTTTNAVPAREQAAPADLTPWFPAGTKPVHVGVYQLESHFPHGRLFRARWDGRRWMLTGVCLPFERGHLCRWRGLAHPPAATIPTEGA